METTPENLNTSEHFKAPTAPQLSGLLLFLEHQTLTRWMADLSALQNQTAHALQQKPGDIALMSDMQNLTGDYEKCMDILKEMQPKISKHFRVKYDLKLKTIK